MCKWITTLFFSAPMLSHLVFFAFNVWREVSFERVSTSFFGVGAACNWISNTYSPALSTSTISKFTRFMESNGMECKWNANKKFRSMPLFAAIALTISRYLSSSIAVWAENKQIKWNSEEFSVVLRKNVQFWSSLWLPIASINFHIYLHLFTKWMKKKISREKGANWRIWLHLKSSVFYFFERKIGFQNELQQIFPRKGKEIEQNVNTSSQIQYEHVFFFITLNIN